MKAFLVSLWTVLHERVWLSYRSTILGLAVTAIGEALNYTLNTVPDPRIHMLCAFLTTIFVAWKDKKVAEGKINIPPKLLAFVLFFVSFGAFAQHPSARAHNPEALANAIEQDPAAVPPNLAPAPVPSKYGGCLNSGAVCFGPSVSISMLAINVSTKKIEGAFSPGIGYGFTWRRGQWNSVGADVYFVVDPGAQQASTALVLKLINGYFRIGVSKGFIGDTSLRVPLGFGVDL